MEHRVEECESEIEVVFEDKEKQPSNTIPSFKLEYLVGTHTKVQPPPRVTTVENPTSKHVYHGPTSHVIDLPLDLRKVKNPYHHAAVYNSTGDRAYPDFHRVETKRYHPGYADNRGFNGRVSDTGNHRFPYQFTRRTHWNNREVQTHRQFIQRECFQSTESTFEPNAQCPEIIQQQAHGRKPVPNSTPPIHTTSNGISKSTLTTPGSTELPIKTELTLPTPPLSSPSFIPETIHQTSKSIARNSELRVAEFKSVGVIVTLGSIKRLSPGRMINDDLIDFGIYYPIQHLNNVIYFRASTWQLYIFKPSITNRQNKMLFKIATKWGQDLNLLKKRFIVIPVNRDSHWFVSIICNPFPHEEEVVFAENLIERGFDRSQVSATLYKRWAEHRSEPPMVFLLDSKYEALRYKYTNVKDFHCNTTMYVIRALRNLHQKLWEEGGSEIELDEESFRLNKDGTPIHIRFHSLRVPFQLSGNDCGMYCFQFVKHWFERMSENNQDYMSMINKDCTNWFNPKSLVPLRPAIYLKILHQCQKQFPNALHLLHQVNPSTVPPQLIKIEPPH